MDANGTNVVMPALGLEVTEGTVLAILVDVGAAVAADSPLLEVATDKADTDIVAPRDGVVTSIDVQVGDTVPVGAVLMRLGGEAPAPAPSAAPEAVEPLSPLRTTVARRMGASQREIPQYRLERDIDCGHLIHTRARLAWKLSLNDLLLQAIGETVSRHPALAARYAEDDGAPVLRRRDGVDVGIAVATDAGLLVPVIRRPHERPLADVAADRVRVVEAARAGTLDLRELTGGTVTLSSLARFGVDRFTAMVNPGESAIFAVGRMLDRVVPRAGAIEIRPMMTVTLALDHRAVDGATGGAALDELARLLEGEMPWRTPEPSEDR